MDLTGKGFEIDLNDLPKCDLFKGDATQQQNLLLICCILSGCDYLESIKGIGFKKAVKLIQIYGDDIKAICQDLKQTGQHNTFSIDEYIDEFLRAYLTFKHQVVYDISQQKLLHLTPLHSTHKSEEMQFLGKVNTDQNLIKQLCSGQLNPETLLPYNDLTKETKDNA